VDWQLVEILPDERLAHRWIAGTPARLKSLRDLKQALSICSASLSQWAAVAALTGPQEWLKQQQADLMTKRNRALDAIAAMGLRAVIPDAAPYIWVDVRSTSFRSNEFVDFARRAGVLVTRGTDFGAAGEGFVRISLAATQEQLQVGLDRLSDGLGGRRK
jgi:aspartate/methionine/tyrosine aminotransferase